MGKGSGTSQRSAVKFEHISQSNPGQTDAATINELQHIFYTGESAAELPYITEVSTYDCPWFDQFFKDAEAFLDDLPVYTRYAILKKFTSNYDNFQSRIYYSQAEAEIDLANFNPTFEDLFSQSRSNLIKALNYQVRSEKYFSPSSDSYKHILKSDQVKVSGLDPKYVLSKMQALEFSFYANCLKNDFDISEKNFDNKSKDQALFSVRTRVEQTLDSLRLQAKRNKLLMQDKTLIKIFLSRPLLTGSVNQYIDTSRIQSYIFLRTGSYPSHQALSAELHKLYLQGFVTKKTISIKATDYNSVGFLGDKNLKKKTRVCYLLNDSAKADLNYIIKNEIAANPNWSCPSLIEKFN